MPGHFQAVLDSYIKWIYASQYLSFAHKAKTCLHSGISLQLAQMQH